jgi:hypothetical protein
MNCLIHVSERDQGTAAIAEAMDAPLATLSRRLSNAYGGSIDNLWIDLELSPLIADRRSSWSFRLQRNVAPPSALRRLGVGVAHNVAHYSVRPDYFELARVQPENVVCYLLKAVYESTELLERKQARLGGFNVTLFRVDFLAAIRALGCDSAGGVADAV